MPGMAIVIMPGMTIIPAVGFRAGMNPAPAARFVDGL
jgi:hypothetical protein